ncbi:TIGR03899 family protein [Agarivorans sp. B2Z047]|uniref:TIGR03899 family protein n=1 Tax=Agarivorans sp. B2Z047 TaxID=2652721 RepID=UPI00128D085C|nr:TIGR03899 family protein [Agarivorans sp. B2Z047]MPW31679.1 TIGR03899 family protein [Agarivorans sp. B2Z047]UQN42361.1 TIGR03899 family protein [Agarivorans sp. B2Z047]
MSDKPITENKNSQVENSKLQLAKIAKQRGLDALLHKEKAASTWSQRAKVRTTVELATQQKNLESIFYFAAQKTSEQDVGSEPDADWLTEFLHLASNTQVKSMQMLWADILSQELATPGSFSVKALRTLKLMTQREAMWFQTACELSSSVGGETNNKILTGVARPASNLGLVRAKLDKISLGQHRMPYHHVLQLTDLGLVFDKELEIRPSSHHDTPLIHGQAHYALKPRYKGARLLYHRFTPIGDELAKLITTQPIASYQEHLEQLLHNYFELH